METRNRRFIRPLQAGCAGLLLIAVVAVVGKVILVRQTIVKPFAPLRIVREHNVFRTQEKWRFAVIGDARWDRRVRAGILEKVEKRKPAFIINLGDVVSKGTQKQWSDYVEEARKSWRGTPYFHIPGGHSRSFDGLWWSTRYYEQALGRRFYSVTKGNWTLLCIDTSVMFLDSPQREWIEAELNRLGRRQNIIVATHMPPTDPRTGESHAMCGMGEAQLALLLKGYKVWLILAAHIHENLQSEWRGIPLYITAQNGSTWESDEHPAHYLEILIDGDKISIVPHTIVAGLKESK